MKSFLTTIPDWYLKFQVMVLTELPGPNQISQKVAEKWIENPKFLEKLLAQTLHPPADSEENPKSIQKFVLFRDFGEFNVWFPLITEVFINLGGEIQVEDIDIKEYNPGQNQSFFLGKKLYVSAWQPKGENISFKDYWDFIANGSFSPLGFWGLLRFVCQNGMKNIPLGCTYISPELINSPEWDQAIAPSEELQIPAFDTRNGEKIMKKIPISTKWDSSYILLCFKLV